MGKHKDKRKKHKKDKKHKKKSRKSSSSEDEWVEKPNPMDSSSEEERISKKHKKYSSDSSSEEERIQRRKKRSSSESSSEDDKRSKTSKKKQKRKHSSSDDELGKEMPNKCDVQKNSGTRDEWMDLPTSFLSVSNENKRRNREEAKKLERERQQYNPQECARELNPYWKDGGDGLPKFKKPTEDSETLSRSKDYRSDRSSNWRKNPSKESSSNWRKFNKEEPKDRRYEEKSDIIYTNEKETPEKSVEDEDLQLSEKELNMLASKLVKAEIMGNTQLVNELKAKLEKARASRNTAKDTTEDVILTHTDTQGRTQPVKLQSEYGDYSNNKKKKKAIETHQDGQRVRYFADDDKYSLKQMFENEKYNTVEDQNSEFIKMASKIRKNDDLDDVFSDNIRKKESDSKIDSRNRDRAINEHQKVAKSLDNCNRCIQSDVMLKHLMVSIGETVYLGLPQIEPLTEGHCMIVPVRHVPCSTQLDENEWAESLDFRRALVRYFASKDEDVIFFETAMSLFKFPHMAIQCIPLPKEEGNMAPIYFKKAIDESETEWAQNKKLVNLKGRDVRKAIPKGLPYFFVSFGMDEGYAHVIEDEQAFPQNFAQEIIGGMLDLHHSKWRKPKRQSFDEQSKRVLEFSKTWHTFDCTVK